ncbi:MAG: hypothetical protein HDT22_11285 [Ruminococcus sp.]|nr:hypothetical protein [Ruminococcus sp.]
MKKNIIARLLLTFLLLIAIVGIFSEPAADSPRWMITLILSKLAGLAAFAAAYRFPRWYPSLWLHIESIIAALRSGEEEDDKYEDYYL